jgi:hypothetical protein
MSRSPLSEPVALTKGTESQGQQYTRLPMELELEQGPNQQTGSLQVTVQYHARQDREIKIPLEKHEIRRLHKLTGSLLER